MLVLPGRCGLPQHKGVVDQAVVVMDKLKHQSCGVSREARVAPVLEGGGGKRGRGRGRCERGEGRKGEG